MNLVYKHEKPLFMIAAIVSAVFWVGLTIVTFGLLLVYLLLGYVVFLFAHSVFISQLKGSGVKISEDQFPDLHAKLISGCEKIGLTEVPEAYVLRTDFFNALATKFLGRHFVVLFSDVVDALEDQPNAIDFYIGHELGHIHRKHLSWSTFIAPASILPLLGASLRRAEEYTCDRYGLVCCDTEDDIKAAISAIAAGDTRWKTLNLDAYLKQVADTGGFWMSFNELTGDYPWLTKRMATAISVHRGEEVKHPRRNGFAWFLALFVPRFGGGGAASLLITIAVIGILAAVAIPAYQEYTQRANYTAIYMESQSVSNTVTEYVMNTNEWPSSLQALGYENDVLTDEMNTYEISLYDNGVVGAKVGVTPEGKEMYIVLEPQVEEGIINWICFGENVDSQHLPEECR